MDRSDGRLGGVWPMPGDPCPSCGGSGVLRTTATGYRTCLTCVGQGTLPCFEASPFPPPAEVLRRRRRAAGFRGELSAWTSGAR
jgi:hypothetical protein